MFQRNDTCYVCAPTGSAAFSAGGKTIHSLFGISVHRNQHHLGPTLQKCLHQQFANIVALIIDERSLLSSELLSKVEWYARKTFHNALNTDILWGKVPILILVGDDFQLPPITPGAFECMVDSTTAANKLQKCAHRIKDERLNHIICFLEFTFVAAFLQMFLWFPLLRKLQCKKLDHWCCCAWF